MRTRRLVSYTPVRISSHFPYNLSVLVHECYGAQSKIAFSCVLWFINTELGNVTKLSGCWASHEIEGSFLQIEPKVVLQKYEIWNFNTLSRMDFVIQDVVVMYFYGANGAKKKTWSTCEKDMLCIKAC